MEIEEGGDCIVSLIIFNLCWSFCFCCGLLFSFSVWWLIYDDIILKYHGLLIWKASTIYNQFLMVPDFKSHPQKIAWFIITKSFMYLIGCVNITKSLGILVTTHVSVYFQQIYCYSVAVTKKIRLRFSSYSLRKGIMMEKFSHVMVPYSSIRICQKSWWAPPHGPSLPLTHHQTQGFKPRLCIILCIYPRTKFRGILK